MNEFVLNLTGNCNPISTQNNYQRARNSGFIAAELSKAHDITIKATGAKLVISIRNAIPVRSTKLNTVEFISGLYKLTAIVVY